MRKIFFKKQEMKLVAENLDDLWYLTQVIDPGDLIKGRSLRKIKLGEDQTKVVRKPVYMELEVERTELAADTLRVTGLIRHGPEDVPLGSYHTFNISQGTEFTIEKENWLKFQVDKVKEAAENKQAKILLVVFDREEAHFAMLKKYGYEVLCTIKGNVNKKDFEGQGKGNFYKEIIKAIEEYDKRQGFSSIVLGSPAFWKDELMKNLDDENLKKKMILATCSNVGNRGFDELLKREEVINALKGERIGKEIALVEELLKEISKDGLAAYGLDDVKNAVDMGAARELLVTDSYISQKREEGQFDRIDQMLKTCDSQQGNITIISHEHDGGRKLEGLGGIGAILRYRI